MKAYAIFAGGGVKGAALAGCLHAARDLNIEFMGYGGTSAGSIVALLAAVGYDASHIRKIMVDEINFHDFLDDQGADLDVAKKGWHTASACLRAPAKIVNNLKYVASFVKGSEYSHIKIWTIPWRQSKKISSAESNRQTSTAC